MSMKESYLVSAMDVAEGELVVFDLGPIIYQTGQTDDPKWTVTLRSIGNNSWHTAFVSAQLLHAVELNTVWENGLLKRSRDVPCRGAFIIDAQHAELVWRCGIRDFDGSFEKQRSTHRSHPYIIIPRVDNDDTITHILVSCAEIFRFYYARSPSLSSNIARFLDPDILPGVAEVLWRTEKDRSCGMWFHGSVATDIEKKILASLLGDTVARDKIFACCTQLVADDLSRYELWPRISVPHNQKTEFKVRGQTLRVRIGTAEENNFVRVMAVTSILGDTYQTPVEDYHENIKSVHKERRKKSGKAPIPRKQIRKAKSGNKMDDATPADADWLMHFILPDGSAQGLPNASSLRRIVTLVDSDPNGDKTFEVGSEFGRGNASTSRGSAIGGDTGRASIQTGSGERQESDAENERVLKEERAKKEALRHLLPNLIAQASRHKFSKLRIDYVASREVPAEFVYIVEGISSLAADNNVTDNFMFCQDAPKAPVRSAIPLIQIPSSIHTGIELEDGTYRPKHAIAASVASREGVTYFFDMERAKNEKIGIQNIFFPGKSSVPFNVVLYILSYQAEHGHWPSEDTHSGVFHTKNRRHYKAYGKPSVAVAKMMKDVGEMIDISRAL